MKKRPWGEGERVLLRKHYERLGAAGMRDAGYLVGRPLGSITKCANLLGLRYHASKDAREVEAPVPRMDPPESRECARLAQWRGPVNRGLPLRWAA